MKKTSWIVPIILLLLPFAASQAAESPEDADDTPVFSGKKLTLWQTSGAVSPEELKAYRKFIASVSVPPNNYDKSLAWKISRVICSLGLVYQLTGDEWYLGEMLRMTDQVLSARNDPVNGVTDYVTGRILPSWPNLDSQFSVNGRKVYYTNDVQTGMILDAVAFSAQLIAEKPELHGKTVAHGERYLPGSGTTYRDKARFYLDRAQESINALIDGDDFFDPRTRLFRFPDNPRMNQVLPGSRGLTSAYNRMFAMGRAMLRVAESERLLNPAHGQPVIHRYYALIESMLDFWRATRQVHRHADFTYYTWSYRHEGRDKPARGEDSGHLGIDVQCLLLFYHLGQAHLGISREELQAIANTYLYVMGGSDDHLSNRMDGSNRGRQKTRGDILRAIGLSEVEPKMFDACAREVLKGVDLRPGVSFAEFLYWRQFRQADQTNR